VRRQHRGGEGKEGHIGEDRAVGEHDRVVRATHQPDELVMRHPTDEDDEEAERKREEGWPERQQNMPQTLARRMRLLRGMWKADLEDEQRNRNGKHAIAERIHPARAFGQSGSCVLPANERPG